MAVICVIMVKNTVTRWIFRRKSNETAPKRGTKLSKRTQRHAVARFFDSLSTRKGAFLPSFSKKKPHHGERNANTTSMTQKYQRR